MREAVEEILKRQQRSVARPSSSGRMLTSLPVGETGTLGSPSAQRPLTARQTLDPFMERFDTGGVDLSRFSARPLAPPSSRPLGPTGAGGFAQRYLAAQQPHLLRAATRARPIPVPSILPPVFIPGTPENGAFAREFEDALRGIAGAVGQFPKKGIQPRPNYEDECDEHNRNDLTNCQIVRATKGMAAARACYESAAQRDAECRRFGVVGIRTPLYWGN